MSQLDDQSTLWKADAHTLAKHQILKGYLQAWMPILAHQAASLGGKGSGRILYVDGFAGPGEYVGHEIGSPAIAIEVALEHSHSFPVPIEMVFVEERRDRCDHLEGVIERYRTRIDGSRNLKVLKPFNRDCEELLAETLQKYQEKRRRFGPALIFLDQFGYANVSMNLIGRVLESPACEVFAFLNWRDLNRFLSDETKWPGITKAFGGDEWKIVREPGCRNKGERLREMYTASLRTRAKARYTCSFAMHDDKDCLLYWLFFCTQNLRGLEVMKKAMWKVDELGTFRYSDKHAKQLSLLQGYNDHWLGEALESKLAGQDIPMPDLEEYVLGETPCYKYNDALARLERDGRITVVDAPEGRRRGSFKKYADNRSMKVRFAAPVGASS